MQEVTGEHTKKREKRLVAWSSVDLSLLGQVPCDVFFLAAPGERDGMVLVW
jgi:hypothetical protein